MGAEHAELEPEQRPPQRQVAVSTGGRRTRPVVQAKLAVGSRADPAEREADAIADQVVRSFSRRTRIARAAARPSDATAVGVDGGPVDGEVESRIRTGGRLRPLDPSIRTQMETGFGIDFSHVKVDTASEIAPRIQASAFTHGNNIHFAPGAYQPASQSGRRLIAHELAHTLQQSGGNGDGGASRAVANAPATSRVRRADALGKSQPARAVGERVQRTLVIKNDIFTERRIIDLGKAVNEQLKADEAFQKIFTPDLPLAGGGGLTATRMGDPRVIALAAAKERYRFDSWEGLETTLSKSWPEFSDDGIPATLDSSTVAVEPGRLLPLGSLRAAIAQLGAIDEPVVANVDSRWRKLEEATKARDVQAKEVTGDLMTLWGACGPAAQTLIERLQLAGGDLRKVHQRDYVDKQDAADLQALLTLPVATTTLIQINEPLIHQFTIEKHADGQAFLHQGYIFNFNALWWLGLEKDVKPHLSAQPEAVDLLRQAREKYGKMRGFDPSRIASNLSDYLALGTHGEESDKIWGRLPFNPKSSEEVRWKGYPITLKIEIYEVGNEAKVRGGLKAIPLIGVVMKETEELLDTLRKKGLVLEKEPTYSTAELAKTGKSPVAPSEKASGASVPSSKASSSAVGSKSDASRPVEPKPVGPTRETPKTLVPSPVVSKPGAAKVDAPKTVGPTPLVSKPSRAKVDEPKPVVPKPVEPKPVEPKPVVSKPVVSKVVAALDRRWDKCLTVLPVKVGLDLNIGPSYSAWSDRKNEDSMQVWARTYLDAVDRRVVQEATQLDLRWRQMINIFEDLQLLPDNVKMKYDMQAKYTTWQELHKKATAGSITYSNALLDTPTAYLDAIETKWKGTTQAWWKQGAYQWGRKGLGWE